MKIVWPLFILLLLYETTQGGNCLELLDTLDIEIPTGNGADGAAAAEIRFEHNINSISLAGIGSGFVDYPGFRTISYDLYFAQLWELWRYGAIRAGAEVVTDFEEALLANAVFGVDVYPFRFGTTPFVGGEVGIGYIQAFSQSNFGFYVAVEAGIFAIMISDLTIATTIRVFTFTRAQDGIPRGLLLRIGFFF